jgi:hypothetical protein
MANFVDHPIVDIAQRQLVELFVARLYDAAVAAANAHDDKPQ